jgi:hypothetical protein
MIRKIYKIKALVPGAKVKPEFKDKTLVCCKAAKGYTHIAFDNKLMRIPEGPLTTLGFEDKYGRGSYFLDYYEWEPGEGQFGI